MVKSVVWFIVKKEIIVWFSEFSFKFFQFDFVKSVDCYGLVYISLIDVCWLVFFLKFSKIVDNFWNICMVCVDKLGFIFVDIILSKVFGECGVLLVGYSFGVCVIYICMVILVE